MSSINGASSWSEGGRQASPRRASRTGQRYFEFSSVDSTAFFLVFRTPGHRNISFNCFIVTNLERLIEDCDGLIYLFLSDDQWRCYDEVIGSARCNCFSRGRPTLETGQRLEVRRDGRIAVFSDET